MARNPSGLASNRRGPACNTGIPQGPAGLRESERYRNCPWPRCLTPDLLVGSKLGQDDVRALEAVAEALFRGGVPDDEAAEIFDRVFGWAEESATWKAAS